MQFSRITRAEFDLFRPTRRFSGRLFSVEMSLHEHMAVACVVSKKVAPHAVDRNKIRRRVREILRTLPQPDTAAMVVFRARAGAQDASLELCKREILGLVEDALMRYHTTI